MPLTPDVPCPRPPRRGRAVERSRGQAARGDPMPSWRGSPASAGRMRRPFARRPAGGPPQRPQRRPPGVDRACGRRLAAARDHRQRSGRGGGLVPDRRLAGDLGAARRRPQLPGVRGAPRRERAAPAHRRRQGEQQLRRLDRRRKVPHRDLEPPPAGFDGRLPARSRLRAAGAGRGAGRGGRHPGGQPRRAPRGRGPAQEPRRQQPVPARPGDAEGGAAHAARSARALLRQRSPPTAAPCT